MKKVLILSLYIFSGTAHLVFAQSYFKAYKEAEETFYAERFAEAVPLYQAIVEQDSTYEDVVYKLEICKLLSDRQYTDTKTFLSFEEKMSRNDKFYYYWKGRIQLEGYQFEEAIESLRRFIKSPQSKSEEIIFEANRWIKWSVTAKKYMDNPDYYEIQLLEKRINTEKAELSPVFFAGKGELLFLSNRIVERPDEFQIYHSTHQGSGSWTEPTPVLNVGVFTRDNANIEVVDEDGRLFQFRTDKGGDLFFSEPTNSKDGWSQPQEFDSKISSTHLSSHFFINEHEDRIIFAKDVGSKSEPNLDLYQSFRDPLSGEWSKPLVFSTSINSEYNEDSPYLSPDESKIYFASDGHETMGGYDIFVSEYDSTTLTWSKPMNLGFPINSPDDEIHFKLNPDQMSGYFTSNRLNTYGDYDIFFFWEIHTIKIKGRVLDGPTGNPITDARIFFRPVAYPDLYYFSQISKEGLYEAEITADDVFTVELKRDDKSVVELGEFEIHATGGTTTTYLKDFYVGEVKNNKAIIPPSTSPPTTKQNENSIDQVNLEKFGREDHVGDRAVVRNVFFDFGDTKVTSESIPTLRALLVVMEDHPQLRIEIAGHTDNIGDERTNQKISEQRARAVMNWLIQNGISPDRLTAKGYGESQPLVSNDDEQEGRELNRRIEIIHR